ncbi:biotin--[acetyl-CoA-carboxylase] ligase [bacterium]|nr:biotin--[acetyl-CoA-carboxylase] ligase [bacterium]
MKSHPALDEIIFLKTIDSTNEEAQRRRSEFSGQNILWVSDEQTAGQGQQGRSWESGVGLGLWMSLFLGHPEHLAHNLQLLSLYTGMILHGTISGLIDAKLCLKWPNDIMIKNRKCGGILSKIHWLGESPVSAIIGVGINLKHVALDFPDSIRDSATSLQQAGWLKPDRDLLLDHFIRDFFDGLRRLESPTDLVSDWNRKAYMLDEVVDWIASGQRFRGRFLGINEEGEAQILVNDVVRKFRNGEIRFSGQV